MSRRLTDTRQGRAAPTLSLRLTEAMAAAVERVRTELVAASPAGLSVSSSDAARVLLGEALAARAVPAAPVAPTRPLTPAVLAQRARSARITEELSAEIERARALPATLAAEAAHVALHTAAGGQVSVATTVANDLGEPLTLRMAGLDGAVVLPPVKRGRWATDGSTPVIDREALLRRVEAAITAGHTARGIARLAKVDESSLRNWRAGARGISEPVAQRLAAALDTLVVGAG